MGSSESQVSPVSSSMPRSENSVNFSTEYPSSSISETFVTSAANPITIPPPTTSHNRDLTILVTDHTTHIVPSLSTSDSTDSNLVIPNENTSERNSNQLFTTYNSATEYGENTGENNTPTLIVTELLTIATTTPNTRFSSKDKYEMSETVSNEVSNTSTINESVGTNTVPHSNGSNNGSNSGSGAESNNGSNNGSNSGSGNISNSSQIETNGSTTTSAIKGTSNPSIYSPASTSAWATSTSGFKTSSSSPSSVSSVPTVAPMTGSGSLTKHISLSTLILSMLIAMLV